MLFRSRHAASSASYGLTQNIKPSHFFGSGAAFILYTVFTGRMNKTLHSSTMIKENKKGRFHINWRRGFSQRFCVGKRQFFAGILCVCQENWAHFRWKRSLGFPTKPSLSGFDGERRSSGATELLPQGKTKDAQLATTKTGGTFLWNCPQKSEGCNSWRNCSRKKVLFVIWTV